MINEINLIKKGFFCDEYRLFALLKNKKHTIYS